MSRLHAAAGQIDLQPITGAPLAGFGSRVEPSIGCHEPLMGKFLLLDDGCARLLWITCDLIGFSPEDDLRLRELLSEKLDMSAANVFVSCTHTHSGPSSMSFRGPLGQVDQAWLARTFGSIADESGAVAQRLRPARLAHASETVTGLGYNRQDGVGPIDERLLVAQFSDDDGRIIATLLNYATHPVVLGERNLMFSGDYPGYATRIAEQSFGGVGLFVQGSAGDVDPVVYRDMGRNAGTCEIAETMGRKLVETAQCAIARAERHSDLRIATAAQRVELRLEAPQSLHEIRALKAEFLGRRGPIETIPGTEDSRQAMFQLAWAEELEQAIMSDAVASTLPVNMFAARIGDLCAVTFPLEIYSQIGLDVRRQFAPHRVLIAAYTNGLLGYAPTDVAITQGGYGPAASYRFFPHLLTPLARGTAAILVRSATELVRTLGSRAPARGTP